MARAGVGVPDHRLDPLASQDWVILPANPTDVREGVFPDVISAMEILGTDGHTKADARQSLGFHAPTPVAPNA
jgi:hypothetical protein